MSAAAQAVVSNDRSYNAFNARKNGIEELRRQFNRAVEARKMLNDHDFTAKVIEVGLAYYKRETERAQEKYIKAHLQNGEDFRSVCEKLQISTMAETKEL